MRTMPEPFINPLLKPLPGGTEMGRKTYHSSCEDAFLSVGRMIMADYRRRGLDKRKEEEEDKEKEEE